MNNTNQRSGSRTNADEPNRFQCLNVLITFLRLRLSCFRNGFKQFGQFPRFVHVGHYIAPPNEFRIDVQLRNSGPLAKLFDTFPNRGIIQDVHGRKIDALFFQDIHNLGRKAALGLRWTALHI